MADLDPCTVLREADAAYIALQSGQSVRAVTDQNGERVEYSAANSANLLRLIEQLACKCTTYQPLSLARQPVRPIRFLF